MDFLDFSRLMRKRSRALPAQVHTVVKDVARTYVVSAADATPVDTGAALSNWQMGLNVSPDSVLPPHVPGRFSSTQIQNFNATMQLVDAVVSGSKPGDALHIVNNLEYIGDLDNGSSSQAPSGMTAIAELASRRVIQTSKVVKPR